MPSEAVKPFPLELLPTLETALQTMIFDIHPLSGGLNQRTFLAGTADGFWVVRLEAMPGVQLQRSTAAQQQALAVGFPTPALAAHDQTTTADGDYQWSVEEFVQGVEFDPPGFDPSMRPVVGRHVGEQLRKLHSIELPAFGLLSPGETAQTPTVGAWLAKRQQDLEPALALAGQLPALPERLAAALATLQGYNDTPRLCHGDFAGTNVLVNETQLVAAVDWEWAQGADPALDFAWWYFWHDDRPTLAALIEGYAPPDEAAFTARVLAYALLHALDTSLLYQTEANDKGIRYCQEKLQQYCR